MTTASVTVRIPQALYHRLERAAARLQKPVEDLLTETLQAALSPADEIPENIWAEIATLDDLTRANLREVAESEMDPGDQQTLDHLLDLQSMGSLTGDQAARLGALRTEYGRILLRKARAFALLAERGRSATQQSFPRRGPALVGANRLASPD